MTDIVRPIPRWLHAWAVFTAAVTLVLLLLGGLVTSFRAGMADPIWPTEPWYLFVIGWQEPNRGYLIEHAHRIAGWTVGAAVGIFALGLWLTDNRKISRWSGFIAIIVLLGAFGEFHRAMIAQRDPAVRITVPVRPVTVMGGALAVVLGFGLAGVIAGVRGSRLRILGVVALVAVMIQGLLGGFRVRLNELVGTDLAAVHGVFAQVVFGLLVSLAVLTGRPSFAIPTRPSLTVRWLAVGLVGLVFVQLVWGALVRHAPTPLSQRLHFLTAFLVVAVVAWLLRAVFADPASRSRAAAVSWLIGLLVAVQVMLGVEAWMMKFGQYTLPELIQPTERDAAVRTAHMLIGDGVLAAVVAITLRVWVRCPVPATTSADTLSESLGAAGSRPGFVAADAHHSGEAS